MCPRLKFQKILILRMPTRAPQGPEPVFSRTVARRDFARQIVDRSAPTALELRSLAEKRGAKRDSPHRLSLPVGRIKMNYKDSAERTRVRRVNSKRLIAKRRHEKFGKELRRCVGQADLLETISMGRSGHDYHCRTQTFLNFCSRMRFPIVPSVKLDLALCEFADCLFVGGKASKQETS